MSHDQKYLTGMPWYRRATMLVPLVVAAVAVVVVATTFVVNGGGRNVGGTARASAVSADQQLHTVVTSALTGDPLAGSVTLASGISMSARADGMVVAVRIDPGDRVTVSAEGYLSAQLQVRADRTVTVILRPTLATVTAQLDTWLAEKNFDAITGWVFSPATGLRFTPMSDNTISGDVPWSAAREVVGEVAMVNAYLLPGVVEEDTARAWFDGKATRVTLAGQPAWHGSTGGGGTSSVWIRSPLLIDVAGIDLSTTDSVLAAMIAAQPAR